MKLAIKWHDACWSMGMPIMRMMDSVGDCDDAVDVGERLFVESVGDIGYLPTFCASAFLLAFFARRSVACVSFLNTRSNSSL